MQYYVLIGRFESRFDVSKPIFNCFEPLYGPAEPPLFRNRLRMA